jgi:hypothetical protein
MWFKDFSGYLVSNLSKVEEKFFSIKRSLSPKVKISGIRFTYKFVIMDTKRKQNIIGTI